MSGWEPESFPGSFLSLSYLPPTSDAICQGPQSSGKWDQKEPEGSGIGYRKWRNPPYQKQVTKHEEGMSPKRNQRIGYGSSNPEFLRWNLTLGQIIKGCESLGLEWQETQPKHWRFKGDPHLHSSCLTCLKNALKLQLKITAETRGLGSITKQSHLRVKSSVLWSRTGQGWAQLEAHKL